VIKPREMLDLVEKDLVMRKGALRPGGHALSGRVNSILSTVRKKKRLSEK
jgi:hypothetical protein